MGLQLKGYQQRSLGVLRDYLRRARQSTAMVKLAFMDCTEQLYAQRFLPQALQELPYVCLRVPTGGGKTFMATHAISIACRDFLQAERCVVLWLAPTNTIVEQTIRTLRNRTHPYREALDQEFGGNVEVLTAADALNVTRGTLDGALTIVVSTLAAMRVEVMEGRKFYEQNGALSHHFTGLNAKQEALLDALPSDGPVHSLTNVLRLRRPVVIMDEAHNARTPLSFDALVRFGPSCVLEFTATPDQGETRSNVLYAVSAAEMKSPPEEQMIKLPIRLRTRSIWKEAVDAAIRQQKRLEEVAKEEEAESGEYIRPIVLVQAQSKHATDERLTVDVLKKALREEFNIPEAWIAVATGEEDDLPEDILKPTCEVRFVLTVSKLREGWDCPFAYVLCSVSNLSSSGAVEQILGRVLRMPYAHAKKRAPLNYAYAFVTSDRFTTAANSLADALVESGLERFEANAFIEPGGDLGFDDGPGPLFEGGTRTVEETLSLEFRRDSLPSEVRERVTVEYVATPQGQAAKLTYVGPPLSDAEATAFKVGSMSEADRVAVERLVRRSRGLPAYPAVLGVRLAVPHLALRRETQLEIFEDQFRDVSWALADCDPLLTESELPLSPPAGQAADVDITAKGKVEIRAIEDLREQITFNDLRGPKSVAELAVWLDRAIDHPDVPQADASLFLHRMIEGLIEKRGATLPDLVAARFRLRDAATEKIRQHRRAVLTRSFQAMLLPDATEPLEVSPALVFEYPHDNYPANRLYTGRLSYQRHYYEKPGDMNSEEAECALLIDQHPLVETWVRNLERRSMESFWLQTSSDKFYPDFVARLLDGRHVVVEYKGDGWRRTADTDEKTTLGALWEARSGGRCLFRLVGKEDMADVLGSIR